MMKRKILRLAAMLLCLLALAPAASAAETGSLKIVGIESPVCLYHVAAPDGALTEAFASAPVKDFSKDSEAVSNARILGEYAAEKNIPGQTMTPDAKGEVLYTPLDEGLYLICSLAAEPEFQPFLVKIPTIINGENIYHVQAEPKSEGPEPTEPPTVPTTPTEPEPEIPQTGTSVWPKYLLLAFGSVITVAGLYDLIRGKEERYE